MNKFYLAIGLVVFASVTIFSSAIFSQLFCHCHDAARVKISVDVNRLGMGVEFYFKEYGRYPDNLEALEEYYFKGAVPVDPWGRDYKYVSNENEVLIFSHGNPERSKRIFYSENEKI